MRTADAIRIFYISQKNLTPLLEETSCTFLLRLIITKTMAEVDCQEPSKGAFVCPSNLKKQMLNKKGLAEHSAKDFSVKHSFERVARERNTLLRCVKKFKANTRKAKLTKEMLTEKCEESRRLSSSFRASNFDFSLEDIEEQKKQMEYFEKLAKEAEKGEPNENLSSGEQAELDMIEVIPGVEVPLKGANENWDAINEGRLLVTPCSCCNTELTHMDSVELVICSDCWVFTPLAQNMDNLESMDQEDSTCSACIGVKAEDLFKWLADQA